MPNADCRMPITFAFLSPLCSLTNSQLVDVSQFLTFCFLLVSQLTCLQTRWLSSLQISWGGVHGIVHFWLVHFLLDSKIADSMYPSSWICTNSNLSPNSQLKFADFMYPSSWICTFPTRLPNIEFEFADFLRRGTWNCTLFDLTSDSLTRLCRFHVPLLMDLYIYFVVVGCPLTFDRFPNPNSQLPNAECRMPIALDSLTLTRPTSPNLSISSWLFHRWLLQLFHPVSSRRQQSHHFHQRLSSGFGVWELNDEEFKVVGWRRRPSQSQEDSAFGIRQSAFGIRQSVKRQKTSWRGRVNELSRQLEKQSGRWMSNFKVQSQSPKFPSSISDFCIFPQKRTFWVHELTSSKKSLSTHWLPAAKLLVIDDWLLNSARQLGKPWLSQLSKLGIRTQDFFTDLQTSVKLVSL